MFRRACLLIVGCLSLVFTVSAQTDQPDWSAWLLNPHSGNAWLVADDGTILREQSGFPRLSSDIREYLHIAVSTAVSTTGRYFVYRRENQLFVRDTTTGQEVLHYGPIPTFDSFFYSWVRRFFNENDTLLAFGLNRSNYQTREGGWEIVILDLATGGVVLSLSDTDPAAQAVNLPGFNHIPHIQRFEDGEVSFFLVPDGTESGPTYAAWTWDIETGAVTTNRVYTNRLTDYLASTGEVIFSANDSRLDWHPCESECYLYSHLNTLQVYDPAVGLPFPFYHDSVLHFEQVHFVQNGEKIFAQSVLLGLNNAPLVWHLIERDGTLIADLSDLNIASLAGIPDGLIFTQDGSPDLMRMNTRDGLAEPTVFWTNPDGGTPLILWASEPAAPETAYTPWAQLAPPQ